MSISRSVVFYGAAFIVVLATVTTSTVRSWNTLERLSRVERESASSTAALVRLQEEYASYRAITEEAVSSLTERQHEHGRTLARLTDSVEGFDSEVGELSGSVRTLEKLTTTDPELLQKYSKIYFLNENFKPADLTVIDEKYDLVNGKQVSVLTDMYPFLERLLEDATDDGVDIMVLSGYRSFDEQASLKSAYSVRYGTGANQFSADQGYSEHQLGTAVDFTTKAAGETLDAFGSSAAFAWLTEHAHRYGFILSYPDGNSYYMYEPWHWRFVGIDLATHLKTTEKRFYDLEQREIDSYLVTLFDR